MKSSCEDACPVDRGCGGDPLPDAASAAGCTLDPGELPDRARAFGELFGRALLRAETDGNRAIWTLAWSPDTEEEARALAAAESGCCSFFEFAIERRGDELRWTATVPHDRQDMLAAIDGIARSVRRQRAS